MVEDHPQPSNCPLPLVPRGQQFDVDTIAQNAAQLHYLQHSVEVNNTTQHAKTKPNMITSKQVPKIFVAQRQIDDDVVVPEIG